MRSLDATCNDDEVPLRIEIYTDEYPEEIFWNLLLLDASTQPEVVAFTLPNDYETELNLYVENVCVDPLACYVYTIFSTFEDGICCNYGEGWYKVFFNDVIVAEGGEFGLSESSVEFGDGCYTVSPSLSSVPTSSSNSPSTFPSLTLLPSNNPSPLPTVVASTLPSVTPSSEPSESSVPSTSAVPSTAPTSQADLIAADEEYGRRYFPRRPLRPEGSFGHQQIPNCNAPSSEGRVGCLTFPKAIRSSPSWAGKILHEPSKCSLDKNLGRRKCEISIPTTRNAISTALKARIDENLILVDDAPDGSGNTWNIAAADVNGDGYVDIVVANIIQQNQLLLNIGDGTFQDPIFLPGSENSTNAVALADMDGDGSVDILIGNAVDTNQLLLNNGDGSFQEPIDIGGYGILTSFIAVADVDNDGVNDVLFGNSDARNYLLRFEQGGTFVEDPIYLPGEEEDEPFETLAIAAVDVNNDGFVDVIIGNYCDQSNQLLLNKGDGSFRDPINLPDTSGSNHCTNAIALADVDGDGFVDLIFGYWVVDANPLYLNRGNGQFVKTADIPGKYTYALAAADIDGDGSVDIVVADYYGSNLLLLNRGDGTGTFHDATELPGGRDMESVGIAVADFDQDGTVDIYIGNDTTQHQMLRNTIRWDFNEPIALPGEATARTLDIAAADLNGDGLIDIIALESGNIELYLNQGDGLYNEALNLGAFIGLGHAFAVADIDNDGHLDLILAIRNGANKALYNGGNATFFTPIDLPNAGNTTVTNDIAVADFDGDGSIDIIFGNEDGSNLLFFNTGDGSFRDPIELPGGQLRTVGIDVADVDGNGSIDIVIVNDSQEYNQLLLNDGNGSFDTEPVVLAGVSDGSTWAIGLADFNNDGYIDIFLGGTISKSVLLINKGNGLFDEAVDVPGSTDVWCVAVADINGDGYVDLITGSDTSGISQLFLNTGDGSFDAPREIPVNRVTTNAIAVADVDGDGTVEFILGNGYTRNYLIHYITCPSGGAQLHSTSWCFDCPSYMGAPTYADGVQKFSTCRECLPDFMQQEGAEQLCTRCAVGEERKFGHNSCSSCPDGTYFNSHLLRVEGNSSNWKNDTCVECLAGEYASRELPAINECFKCRPGEYQPNRGSSECNICEAGSFQTRQGQSSCQLCDRGGYCNATSTFGGGYRSCPPGTFNDELGMFSRSSCIECPQGTYSIETGANSSASCLPCEAGTFNNETGKTKCSSCPIGTFQRKSNQSSCDLCKAGSYADKPGLTECNQCPYRLDSVEGSSICPFCSSGFYMNNTSANEEDVFKDPFVNCLDCPVYINTTCPSKNTTLQTLIVPFGYWRASIHTSQIYKCNNKVCVGSKDAASAQKHISTDLEENPYCLEGHEGPLCQVCKDRKAFFSDIGGKCLKCPSLFRVALQTCLILIICVVAGALYKFVSSRWFESIHLTLSRLNITTTIKILVSFYQVLSSFQVVYGVQISEELVAWFTFLNIFSLEIFDLTGLPRSCIGSISQQLVFNATWPFIVVLLGACLILGRTVYQSRSSYSPVVSSDTENGHAGERNIDAFRSLVQTGIYHVISLSIVVLYFAIPMVSRGIFDAIKCRPLKEKDFGEPPLIRSYLLVDMDIECDAASDSMYENIQVLFWFFFALWPIMIPLGFLALLIHIRDAVKRRIITPLASASRFLWNDYDQAVWFWDVIDLWRKTFLTGFIMFIDTQEGSSKVLRLVVATIVSMLYLGILAISRPYKRQQDLYLAFIANFLLATSFVAGIILQLCDQDEYNSGSCSELVARYLTPFSASLVVIAASVGMFFIAIGFLAVFTANALLAPAVRLTSGDRPNLEISDNCTFHAFMSHVWATGQAKTHVITNKLKLFMPGLKVWLDVNDLEDITKLEEYVDEAEVFILFYSDGYFQSRNCRREIYTAVKLKKPTILLHDGCDSEMLKNFRAECLKYCVDAASPGPIAIFNHFFVNESIQWLDAGAFSAASLKMIYMQILTHLPHYRAHPLELSNGITVPGEQGPDTLQNHVDVLVCKGNHGAEALAEEVKASLSRGVNRSLRSSLSRAVKKPFRTSLSRGSLSFRVSPLINIIDAEEYFEQEQNEEVEQEQIEEVEQEQIEEDGSEVDNASSELRQSSDTSTVLLLYLNEDFFDDDGEGILRQVVQSSLEDPSIKVVLVHEQDVESGGCPFSYFFGRVPQYLIDPPYEIFKDIAIPLYSTEEYRVVSIRQIIRQFKIEI